MGEHIREKRGDRSEGDLAEITYEWTAQICWKEDSFPLRLLIEEESIDIEWLALSGEARMFEREEAGVVCHYKLAHLPEEGQENIHLRMSLPGRFLLEYQSAIRVRTIFFLNSGV